MAEFPAQQINRLRKSGNLQEAWKVGCAALKLQSDDKFLNGAIFWVCYDRLKGIQNKILERGKNSNNYKPNDTEFERIQSLISNIEWLNIEVGGFEYSRLLTLFRKNLECFPGLVRCLLLKQDSLFTDEDKEPYKGEHGESPSLVLTCTRKVAKAWQQSAIDWQIELDDVLRLLETARQTVRDTAHLIWLDYDQAKCLIIAGRYTEARKFVISVLQKKQTESWAWGALAATYRKEDAEIAIICFCKGVTHSHDDKFSIPLLKGLVPLLANTGRQKQASMCVSRLVNIYKENNWKLKADIEEYIQADWYDASIDVSTLKNYFNESAVSALNYLYGPTSECLAVVESIHQSGKGFNAYASHSEKYSVRLGLFKQKKLPLAGDYVNLITSEDSEGKKTVVSVSPSSVAKLDDVECISGEIRVTPKGFAFVGETFIPPFLVADGIDGKQVKVMRIRDMDKIKNKLGWKGIKIEVLESLILTEDQIE